MSRFAFIRCLILFCCLSLLFGCSKISQDNYQKIQPNMTMQEVVAILGEPTHTENISIAGISGASAVWRDSSGEIAIQFLNDRVTVKTFSKESEKSKDKPDNT